MEAKIGYYTDLQFFQHIIANLLLMFLLGVTRHKHNGYLSTLLCHALVLPQIAFCGLGDSLGNSALGVKPQLPDWSGQEYELLV